MLAVCLTGLLVHGVLPESMISVILAPVIKDKTGKINSKDNYRPIALASVLSKVLESIILDTIEMYLVTHDNQYGFKRKHGTDLGYMYLHPKRNYYEVSEPELQCVFVFSGCIEGIRPSQP